jgi:phenylacetate-CoA ligase
MRAVVETLAKLPPKVLLAYAQASADLARYVNQTNARAWDEITVITGAERLFPADRVEMERAFGPVFETYGSREVMLMACECEQHDGMHVSAENILLELVVRENDSLRPARPGETGEVVVTDLHNYGMPFVRYLNGDLAVAREDDDCACGRGLPRIAYVDGRVTDTLQSATGEKVSGLVFNVLFVVFGESVRAFQAIQRVDRSLVLRIVATPAFDASAEARLRQTIASYFGPLPLSIERVDALPAEASGKRRFVIVERGDGARA